ncbi:MAG: site-specific integrase [Acidimicrobiales bacterium]
MVLFLNDDQAELHELIEAFAGRYPNPRTARAHRRLIQELFRHAGRSHPNQLTEADLLTWATHGDPANNTVYDRLSKARTFLKWCQRNDYADHNVSDHLSDFNSPLRTYRRTYGKVQAQNPGRWLTHQEAYGALIGQCRDGTDIGLRDEIAIGLGLMGMRASEITNLTLANLKQCSEIQQRLSRPLTLENEKEPTALLRGERTWEKSSDFRPDKSNSITWTGKGRKPRQATPGASLVAALTLYLDRYRQHVKEMSPDLPLICPQMRGGHRQGRQPRLAWGKKMAYQTLWDLITNRAAEASLGHVAPHDLRRTAAGILHRATDGHGAHHFDLLDIQKVLGHSDPATTMRSYLEPMQTEVLDRAALFLTTTRTDQKRTEEGGQW